MIEVICDKCGKEINKKGAILWSPPKLRFLGEKETCEKYHICCSCFEKILKFIK
jgi:hypothetical protein